MKITKPKYSPVFLLVYCIWLLLSLFYTHKLYHVLVTWSITIYCALEPFYWLYFNHLEQTSNGSTKTNIAITYLRPFLPLVAFAGLSTVGMLLILFLLFFVGLSTTLALFMPLPPTFIPQTMAETFYSPHQSRLHLLPFFFTLHITLLTTSLSYPWAYPIAILDCVYYIPYQKNTNLQFQSPLHYCSPSSLSLFGSPIQYRNK